ncbi:MAG: hydrogenase formation protein HypD [Alphaproteobacteria bacterium]
MKYLDEFRDPAAARAVAADMARLVTRPWTIMEVCGGQTNAILRHGIDQLLPDGVALVHGPGCPVCVTPAELIDKAIEISRLPGVTLVSFGDMARVPGTEASLLDARAEGADLRLVYSPLDALDLARAEPGREFVFFAVGFETTAPATAMAVHRARREGLANFSLLVAHVLVPPAMESILAAPGNRVRGFLAAGHVCTVMGMGEYGPIAARYRVPIVVTGFEPLDILQGVHMCLAQLEGGRAEVENQYARAVRPDGNEAARALIAEVFRVRPRHWRGVGEIAASGLGLAPDYAAFDAERRFGIAAPGDAAPEGPCIAGAVLQGRARPTDCPAFGDTCTPTRPLGAPMVSSEGACGAYFRHRGGAREAVG